MQKPNLYERMHWAVFNGLAKLFGVLSCFISTVFCILIISGILGGDLGQEYPAGLLILFVPLAGLGFLMVKAKPFYPKKYKEWYESGRYTSS